MLMKHTFDDSQHTIEIRRDLDLLSRTQGMKIVNSLKEKTCQFRIVGEIRKYVVELVCKFVARSELGFYCLPANLHAQIS